MYFSETGEELYNKISSYDLEWCGFCNISDEELYRKPEKNGPSGSPI